MMYLLDTCAFIWYLEGNNKLLPAKACRVSPARAPTASRGRIMRPAYRAVMTRSDYVPIDERP